jgi:hypothetical protein
VTQELEGTDEVVMGRGPTCCLSAHWSLMSHRGRRRVGVVVVVVEGYGPKAWARVHMCTCLHCGLICQ